MKKWQSFIRTWIFVQFWAQLAADIYLIVKFTPTARVTWPSYQCYAYIIINSSNTRGALLILFSLLSGYVGGLEGLPQSRPLVWSYMFFMAFLSPVFVTHILGGMIEYFWATIIAVIGSYMLYWVATYALKPGLSFLSCGHLDDDSLVDLYPGLILAIMSIYSLVAGTSASHLYGGGEYFQSFWVTFTERKTKLAAERLLFSFGDIVTAIAILV